MATGKKDINKKSKSSDSYKQYDQNSLQDSLAYQAALLEKQVAARGKAEAEEKARILAQQQKELEALNKAREAEAKARAAEAEKLAKEAEKQAAKEAARQERIYYKGSNGDILNSENMKPLANSFGIRSRSDIASTLYDHTYRFGLMNPYGSVSTGREFLFFTKPDLNIYRCDPESYAVNRNKLNKELEGIPFWDDMLKHKKKTIDLLEDTATDANGDRFNHLLQNQCASNLEVTALEANMIDTPQNMYGVGFSYRGSSESSDDNPTFSLEFRDTRWLDVYSYFKAYEEYEKLKAYGLVSPKMKYAVNKIIHDQFAIYKFIVDEDMETIIYWGKMYGVVPVSLPRDTFSSPTFDGGISYNISFKAAFYEDMIPDILTDFNALSKPFFNSRPKDLPIFNKNFGHVEGAPAQSAYVFAETNYGSSDGKISYSSKRAQGSSFKYTYRLVWRT